MAETPRGPASLVSLLALIAAAAVVLSKGIYAWTLLGVGRAVPWAISRELLALALTTWVLARLHGSHALPARLLRGGLLAGWLLSLLAYLATAAAHSVLGLQPRLEFLKGLTWGMIGPSVVPLLGSHRLAAAGALLAIPAGLLLIHRARERLWAVVPGRRSALPLVLGSVALVADAEVRGAALGARVGLFTRALEGDRAIEAGVSPDEARIERAFFDAHEARLRAGASDDARYGPLLSASRGKNILFVSLESVRWKDLPLYGGNAKMPFLESLAPHAVRLERLYSQDVRSTKSFGAFELGEYELLAWESYSHGLTRRFQDRSLASRLRQAGYFTAALVNGDSAYDNNAAFHRARGYDQVLYQPEISRDGTSNSDDLKLLQRVDELLAQHAGQPAYLHLWPMATHHPYGREYWADIGGWNRAHPDGIQHRGPEDHARYLASLGELDDFLRRLVEVLRKHGVDASTTLVLAGDHGEAFGEHTPRNVFHGIDVFEESVRVAGLVYHPSLPAPVVESRLFMLKDLPASILDLAGAKEPFLNSGRSVFRQYAEEVPAYLYNSFSSTFGIVHRGRKLREKDGAFTGATLESLVEQPDAEFTPVRVDDADFAPLRAELKSWREAMAIRTRRLLAESAPTDVGTLQDTFRVYCDPGDGFVEDNKAVASLEAVPGVPTSLEVPLWRPCRALRLVPLFDCKLPRNVRMRFELLELTPRTADGGTALASQWRTGTVAAPLREGDLAFLFHEDGTCKGIYMDLELPSLTQLDSVSLRVRFDARKR